MTVRQIRCWLEDLLLPNAGTMPDNGVAVAVNQFRQRRRQHHLKLTFTVRDWLTFWHVLFKFRSDNGGYANGGADLDPNPKLLYVSYQWQRFQYRQWESCAIRTTNTVTMLEDTYWQKAMNFGLPIRQPRMHLRGEDRGFNRCKPDRRLGFQSHWGGSSVLPTSTRKTPS